MGPHEERVVKQAEEALRKAEHESDPAKAIEILEEAAKKLVALGHPPFEPLQTIRVKLKALASSKKGKKADDKTKKATKGPALGYNPPPPTLPGFPKAKRAKGKTPMGGKKKRARWINDDGDILEWDYQHGKIERYNKKGKHKGEYDPNTGGQTKLPNPKRTITPTIIKPMKGNMVYYLRWFDKEGDEYMGESLLRGVGEADVRSAFKLEPEEPPGDCIEVGEEDLNWLGEKAEGIAVRLDLFDYFVEAVASPK